MKKIIAETLITRVIADKTLSVGMKAYINNSRPASTNDLLCLLACIRAGSDKLLKAYTDAKGFWHFITLA